MNPPAALELLNFFMADVQAGMDRFSAVFCKRAAGTRTRSARS